MQQSFYGTERDDAISAGVTRTNEIFDVLRRDIVETRLKPDGRLRFDELRATYKIGISPLREALMRLDAEGLVVLEPRRGYRVAPVSPADLREVARIRAEFDSLAISESIVNGDEQWEGLILSAFHILQKRKKIGPDGELDPRWEELHIRFHDSLVSRCCMPKLLELRKVFESQALRYRRIAVHYLRAARDDVAEHRRLQDLVLERNAAAATAAIREHYLRTVEIILNQQSLLEQDRAIIAG